MASAHFLAPPHAIIDAARNGRMFILVDDEDRENEGDLVIPAQMATPEAINFMAQHGRGLICLAITRERGEELALPMMDRRGREGLGTAFTVSIEAREGVTTGISAADRARTIAAAIDPGRGPDRLVSPGHVFPLIARDGGVLVRAGHTEAAVDIARLAGLQPAGAICEIMRDDGRMARRDELIAFADRHGLLIGAIRDLIAYRRRHDRHIQKRAEFAFESRWGGQWTAHSFVNRATGTEHLAAVKGRIDPERPVMVRMHRMSHLTDVFGERSDRSSLLSKSMEMIAEHGSGIVALLNRPMQGDIMSRMLAARAAGTDVADLPELAEVRDYGAGAQVLAEFGVQDMILLSNSRATMVALAGYGLSIVEQREIAGAGRE